MSGNMPDATSSPPRARRVTKALSADTARDNILAKLTKASAKGVASYYTAKTSDADRALYDAALAALESAEQVFVDRRKPKPKYYRWDARPTFPSPASVADELAAFSTDRFPRLTSAAEFKKHLGKDREKTAALSAALDLLIEQKRLLALLHGTAKKQVALYVPAEPLRAALAGGPQESRPIAEAYAAVVHRTGFPAVMLAEIQRESRVDLPTLHRWALAEHHAGRAVLSLGDWSLASAAQQAAVLELHGERYLQIRLLV